GSPCDFLRLGCGCTARIYERISIALNHTLASSPSLSRRPRMSWHGAKAIEVAETSPATTSWGAGVLTSREFALRVYSQFLAAFIALSHAPVSRTACATGQP